MTMTKTNASYRDQIIKNLNALLDSGIDVTLDIRANINVPARTHHQPAFPDNGKTEAVVDLAQRLARAKAVIKVIDKNCAELFEENAKLQSDIDDLLEKSASPDDKPEPEPEPDLTPKRAKRKYKPKLTQEQVWAIRRYHKMGRLNVWIKRRMGLSESTIWRTVNNKSFTHIPPEPPRKPIKVHVGEGVVENGNSK